MTYSHQPPVTPSRPPDHVDEGDKGTSAEHLPFSQDYGYETVSSIQ